MTLPPSPHAAHPTSADGLEQVDCVVIGAGVVGLACARALAQAGRDVLILECENQFGSGISSRNSEVIHAGLYYPPGSLKAELCRRGQALLYAYCAERAIPHQRCDKLIVSTHAAQEAQLHHIRAQAEACGVRDLQWLNQADLSAREPALRATAALWSPSTGIVDSHALMLSLLADAEHHGAVLVCATRVHSGRVRDAYIELDCHSTHAEHPAARAAMRLRARTVINAAGLAAPALAQRFEGLPARSQPRAYYAKGHYFSLRGAAPFRHLIYPIPEAAGLGVHLTLDLAGRARFGPDVDWLAADAEAGFEFGLPPKQAYTVTPERSAAFYAAIRAYWPELPDDALVPDYAGIRPKLSPAGSATADFCIDGPHGSGLIQLFGIESPGLTASLALAERVAQALH